MNTRKIAAIIVLGIIIILLVVLVWNSGRSTGTAGNTLANDESVYTENWREPGESELVEIGALLSENRIADCAEYHVKEIRDGKYVVACTSDGTDWRYYTVYTALDRVYLADEEMTERLNPPR